MVYPSGEVETTGEGTVLQPSCRSGWIIHPGKLKLGPASCQDPLLLMFRMVYPSGEVETGWRSRRCCLRGEVLDGLFIRGS